MGTGSSFIRQKLSSCITKMLQKSHLKEKSVLRRVLQNPIFVDTLSPSIRVLEECSGIMETPELLSYDIIVGVLTSLV